MPVPAEQVGTHAFAHASNPTNWTFSYTFAFNTTVRRDVCCTLPGTLPPFTTNLVPAASLDNPHHFGKGGGPVPYTPLTLPTNFRVLVLVLSSSRNNKNNQVKYLYTY